MSPKTIFLALAISVGSMAAAQAQTGGDLQTGPAGTPAENQSTSGTISGGGQTTRTGLLSAAETANTATHNAYGKTKVSTSTDGSMSDGSTSGTMNGGGAASKAN
jgi:hypothetical protein